MPAVVRVIGGGVFPDSEMDGDDGLFARSHVFCHECGAEGPSVDDVVFSRDECDELERQAVDLWQKRNSRHRDLFDSGKARGLNDYPRTD